MWPGTPRENHEKTRYFQDGPRLEHAQNAPPVGNPRSTRRQLHVLELRISKTAGFELISGLGFIEASRNSTFFEKFPFYVDGSTFFT